jgi:hypothetical protein
MALAHGDFFTAQPAQSGRARWQKPGAVPMALVPGAAQSARQFKPTQGARHILADAPQDDELALRLRLLLLSGGDERIWPDALSGRSRYGTTSGPAPDARSGRGGEPRLRIDRL